MDAFGKLIRPRNAQQTEISCHNRFQMLANLRDACNNTICQCHTSVRPIDSQLSFSQVQSTLFEDKVFLTSQGDSLQIPPNIPPAHYIVAPEGGHVNDMAPPGGEIFTDRNNSSVDSCHSPNSCSSSNLPVFPTQYCEREDKPQHSSWAVQDIDSIALETFSEEIKFIRQQDDQYCNRILGEGNVEGSVQPIIEPPSDEYLTCYTSDTEVVMHSIRRLSPQKLRSIQKWVDGTQMYQNQLNVNLTSEQHENFHNHVKILQFMPNFIHSYVGGTEI